MNNTNFQSLSRVIFASPELAQELRSIIEPSKLEQRLFDIANQHQIELAQQDLIQARQQLKQRWIERWI